MALNIPFLLMMVLTFIVWCEMVRRRFSWLHRDKLSMQVYSSRLSAQVQPEYVRQAGDNFQNLFELPVLFYALCLYLAWGNEAGMLDILLAYGFVAGRYIHSFIQCTYNNVAHRAFIYGLSTAFLWFMLARTVWGLFFY